MTREDALTELERIASYGRDCDVEGAHLDADGVLCDLLTANGFWDVVEVYGRVAKWYS